MEDTHILDTLVISEVETPIADQHDCFGAHQPSKLMIRREAALLPQSRSEASDFLDEDSHLVFLNGAGAVLVELLEAGVEVGLGELA